MHTASNPAPCALVTGAGRGIGRGIALCLAEAGYDIAAGGTAPDPGNTTRGVYEVKERIEALGRRCVPVAGDIACREDHARMIACACEAFGGIDLLVNNAGVAPRVRRDMLDLDEEGYDRLQRINTRGTFFLTQAVAKRMIEQQRTRVRAAAPCIVFITSISAEVSSPARAEYCISKAALSMTARLFAHRLAEFDIAVFEVRPGIIATDMTAAVKDTYDTRIADGLLVQPRWGTPQDVGRAVAALAGGGFAYSTGQIIEVSGGLTLPRL